MTRGFTAYESKLDRLIRDIEADLRAGKIEDYLMRTINEAVCLRISGYLEVFVRECFGVFCDTSSNPAVARYARSNLERVTNLNAGKSVAFVTSFSPKLGSELSQMPEMSIDGEWKSALDSIYNLRNNLAHGRDGSLNFSNLRDYYLRIRAFTSFMQTKIPGMK